MNALLVAGTASDADLKPRLRAAVLDCLTSLRERFDVVIREGAGSPAEINLRAGDLANMGLLAPGLEMLTRLTGRPVLGICAGHQMLAGQIHDEVESQAGTAEGLGLLPATVRFQTGKVLRRCQGESLGQPVTGYQIHHGVTEATGGEPFPGGCSSGEIHGTSWHGLFEGDGFRQAFLRRAAAAAGRAHTPAGVSFQAERERQLDALGDLIAGHLDTAALLRLIEGGAPAGLPFIPPGAPGQGGSLMPQGKPAAVPDDGLTTRQRRQRPLPVVVHTGEMKGKSTAASGLALRARNQGWPIVVYQFVKSAKWKTGEESAFRALGRMHAETGEGAPVTWHKMGAGQKGQGGIEW